MIRKLIYLLGVKLRNDKIWDCYNFLQDSDRWDLEKLKKNQFQKCKKLLEAAYKKTVFYKEKFEKAGINPGNFKCLDDLKKFPSLTKKELLDRKEDIQILKGFDKLFFSETSGSSGQPLVFYRNKEWDAFHRAAIFRGYSWYGVKPWEKNGYFWGFNIYPKKAAKVHLLDLLQNRFRMFSYSKEEIKKFVKKLEGAVYLEGYSSMIYEVAKSIEELGCSKKFSLKLVKGTSEKIFSKYQETAKKVFGQKIVSEYGAAEAGIIAFECPKGAMHIAMENVIVEVEDNEIVVTNLLSASFPIIRYKLGDYIEVDKDTQCACGRAHQIVRDVMGRVGNVIYGAKECYPSLVLYYIFKNMALEEGIVLNYQVEQKEAGELIFKIEQNLDEKQKRILHNEIHKYFGADMGITLKKNQDLVKGNEKVKDFISHLPIK